MTYDDPFTGDTNGTATNAMVVAPASPARPRPMPTLDLDNAYKTLSFYQAKPQYLANPYTAKAANAHLAAASKIISMNMQLERLNNSGEAAKTAQSLIRNNIKQAGEIVSAKPDAALPDGTPVASLFTPGDNGKMAIENPALTPYISALYGQHVKTGKEPTLRTFTDETTGQKVTMAYGPSGAPTVIHPQTDADAKAQTQALTFERSARLKAIQSELVDSRRELVDARKTAAKAKPGSPEMAAWDIANRRYWDAQNQLDSFLNSLHPTTNTAAESTPADSTPATSTTNKFIWKDGALVPK